MRILLVEDDPTTSKSIELMLQNANLNVYATDLGEEGVDLAKLYDYDLILLDLNLPDMTGIDILARLKANEHTRRLPVIVLTTTDDQREIQRLWLRDRYHAPSDDLDQPIEPKYAVAFNRYLERLILAVANAPERPAWNADSFFKRFEPKR